MRRLLSFISTRFFWVLLGLLSISLLIWFFGPIVSIGNYKPLASNTVRLVIIILIFIVWLGKIALKRYIQAQRNKELVDEIKSSQEPILKHVKKDSSISQQFEEIDSVLKSAKFSNSSNFLTKYFSAGQYLYQMPWYVVMGAAGTGKTTVLKESGLNFPLESSFGASISGLAGTKDCDWFLTDDAVLLDTAGRLSLHDNGETDTYDWLEFISLLKKYRPRQPINGVVVTIGLDDLLSDKTDFQNITIELRKRIHEMRAMFGIDFPVYLVITKLDILKGFNEFFHQLSENERNKSLGFTIPDDLKEDDEISNIETIGYVKKHLTEIKDNIEASYLRVIDSVEDKDEKNSVFAFSNEFSVLNDRLVLLFKELNKSSKFEDVIKWRGIFFTSATQNGDNIDPVFNGLINNFKLTPKYVKDPDQRPSNTKSYFIHDLFKNVIFNEANLASSNKVWSHKNKIFKWVVTGAMVGAGLIFSAYMFSSYLTNNQYLYNVDQKVTGLDKEMSGITQTKDMLQAVELADKIKSIPKTQPFIKIDNAPIKYRLGLYQGDIINEISQAAYNRALRERVMPLISFKIDDLLRDGLDNSSIDSYNALKAYLMLYDDSKFDSEFMLEWLIKNFDKSSIIKNSEQKQKVREALQLILEQEGLSPSLPLDTVLVDQKRQAIARNDISIMILNDTFLQISNEKVSPVSFDTMGGKQSRLIFTRLSGKPITETINPIYTKQAYLEYVLPELLKSTAKLYSEEEWVLGNYASLKSSQKETLEEAKSAYFSKYISAWNSYISDISLKQPSNLREARDIAKILSDTTSSPLSNLIKGISENTTLNLKKQLDEKGEKLDNSAVDRLISRAGLSGMQSRLGNIEESYLNTLKFNTPVDDEFSEFHLLTKKNASSDAVIYEVILSIKDLYEYLDILSIAVEKGVDLPSNDSLYKYRAEVNRLPSPFRQMFDRFSVYILNESLDEMNERVKQAKLEEQALEDKRKKELEDKQREQDLNQQEQAEVEEQALINLKKKQGFEAFNNMKSSLKPITSFCSRSISQRYPFNATATKETPLANFNKIFATTGQYYSFMKLSPEVINTTHATSFKKLIQSYENYSASFKKVLTIMPIHDKYFVKNDDNAGFDFDLEFVNVSPEIEQIVFKYGGQTFQYSHGPVVPHTLTWPLRNKGSIELSGFLDGKLIGSIKNDGDWGLFRLLDSAEVLSSNNTKTLLKYSIDNKEVIIQLTPKAIGNPFKVDEIRRFSCP